MPQVESMSWRKCGWPAVSKTSGTAMNKEKRKCVEVQREVDELNWRRSWSVKFLGSGEQRCKSKAEL